MSFFVDSKTPRPGHPRAFVLNLLAVLTVCGLGSSVSLSDDHRLAASFEAGDCAVEDCRSPYPNRPQVITLDVPIRDRLGGMFVHDLDGDGLMDFVIAMPGNIAAYDHHGKRLWHHRDKIVLQRADRGRGYPGMHHPGAIAGDVDGDGQAEVAYLTVNGDLLIRSGATGIKERTYRFAGGHGLAIANFRGRGDRDAVIQYDQRRLRAVSLESGKTLWKVNDWWGIEHSLVRTMDLDGDGRDEVLGPVILNHRGNVVHKLQRPGSALSEMDSMAVGDIVPGGGVEIVLAEQRGNNETIVMGAAGTYWGTFYRSAGGGECRVNFDPDKVTVGDFDLKRAGLEIFARSSCGNHPWVMDAQGQVIASWNVPDTAPRGWCHYEDCHAEHGYDTSYEFGIDLARAVTWHGSGPQLLFVKERHVAGKIALIDALTGEFVKVWNTSALRSYAADIAGDYREELMVLEKHGNASRLLIFFNEAENHVSRPPLWQDRLYRRVRQNWNYYSP